MRVIWALTAALILGAGPASAYENFIPLGHSYSPDNQTLPEFGSEEDQINLQTDIFETEAFAKGRGTRETDSFINRFISNQETKGGDFSIDY